MRSGVWSSESDAMLVAAARRGDKVAFAALLGRHQPVLLALCRRALADPILAEDAAQEAALTAYLSLDRLRRTERFGPWLAGIGLNVCRSMIRDRSRDGTSWDARGGSRILDAATPDDGPDALAEAAELATWTRTAINVLPPGQRAAVRLFYLSDRTHAETADALGISVGAVKTRLHKARASLRQQLIEEGDGTMDERLTRRTLTKTAAAVAGSAALAGAASSAGATEGITDMARQWNAQGLVPVRVADVRRKAAADGKTPPHLVLLEEVDGARRLAVYVGPPEGTAVALHLERAETPRPLTVAFAANLLDAAGGKLREVRIDRLVETVFYATAHVETSGGIGTVDARPSDAINLALISGAPILVAADILDSSRTDNDLVAGTEGASEIVADWMSSWPSRSSSPE